MLNVWRQLGAVGAARRRRALVNRILDAEGRLLSESDAAIRRAAQALTWQAAEAAPADDFLIHGFSLVREAARRIHGQAHFSTQLAAGVVLATGGLAEMQTGEGKTLTALLPTFLQALAGRGCHVVTANDYLALRDAEFARPVFEMLGLRVGCVTGDIPYDDRGPEYACDVTYGTAREFGFDFLRDRLAQDAADAAHASQHKDSTTVSAAAARERRQRPRYFALVDEADSVLIDDARTPLIIALGHEPDRQEADFYHWCQRAAQSLDVRRHLSIDAAGRCVRLTQEGCRRVVSLGNKPVGDGATLDRVFHQIEQSLAAHHFFRRDHDYVVGDGGVEIVDASTGRVATGRKWRGGLQQAVEVKERLIPTATTSIAAKISIQSYFRGYKILAGLTGTARGCAAEFQKVYGLPVATIPTRLPCMRTGKPARIFVSRAAKLAAIAAEVAQRHARGQAVLVGTPSVNASEQLSNVFKNQGIAHVVLNCRRHAHEAEIVREAGQPRRVTIATNMAGRGTDIAVSPEVLSAGGLHVIATEMHSSPRIDRQLIGRTARQGEPGSYQFMLSLDDELFTGYENSGFARAKQRAQRSGSVELSPAWRLWFALAQRQLAAAHERQRRELLRQERRRERSYRQWGLDPLLDGVE